MGSQSVGSTLMSLTNGMSEIFFLKKKYCVCIEHAKTIFVMITSTKTAKESYLHRIYLA